MVGGTVIEVIITLSRVWINCRDTHYGDECAIYVERTDKSRSVSPGDSIWWQGDSAYWGPKVFKKMPEQDKRAGIHYDIELKRIGNSGVSRPKSEED